MDSFSFFFYAITVLMLVEFAVIVYLLVKFITMANSVEEIKDVLVCPKQTFSFKKEFYKYIISGEKGAAKQLLVDEIGKCRQFEELMKGGNETYMKQMKDELNSMFQKEMNLVGLVLNFDAI